MASTVNSIVHSATDTSAVKVDENSIIAKTKTFGQAPKWFVKALDVPCKHNYVDVDGAKVHYLRWYESLRKQGLVFVHGGGAHSYWWSFIAPFFDEYDCIAICSSGCGDSDHREVYSSEIWAKEILEVIRSSGLNNRNREGPPVIVAHSLGTFPALKAALSCTKAELGGLILVDQHINSQKKLRERRIQHLEARKQMPGWNRPSSVKVYPNSNPPTERFRGKIKQEDRKWVAMEARSKQKVKLNTCPVTVIYGTESALCDEDSQKYLREEVGTFAGLVEIPGAAHHVWLDQPIAFVVGLKNSLNQIRRTSGNSAFTSRL